MSRHPYEGLGPEHFWSRSVAAPSAHEVDPHLSAPFRIGPADPVSTIGSCFAQHLSRFLRRESLDFLVTESGPAALDAGERLRRTYGVFTARFGNVYTARQAVQLLDRAYGRWSPDEPAWATPAGRWVDPFRPTVEPDGFASPEEMDADRALHFAAVRRMCEESSVIVLTLGLTEAWRSRTTGAVYPLVPGAAGGVHDPALHEWVNFSAADVTGDLLAFERKVHAVNPAARLMLTVSPVPLIATYSKLHVLTATAYSKAALRVAAAEAEANGARTHYFPSYEVITGAHAGNRYFAGDLREVSDAGVAHVMRIFRRHYIDTDSDAVPEEPTDGYGIRDEISRTAAVLCDEELLDADRRAPEAGPVAPRSMVSESDAPRHAE